MVSHVTPERRRNLAEWLSALTFFDAFIALWASPRLPRPWNHVVLGAAGLVTLVAAGALPFLRKGHNDTARVVVARELRGVGVGVRRLVVLSALVLGVLVAGGALAMAIHAATS